MFLYLSFFCCPPFRCCCFSLLRGPFSFLSSPPPFSALTIVSRAWICVAGDRWPLSTEGNEPKKMHPESHAILGTSSEKDREKDAHFARSRAFFECDAHAFGVRVGRRGTRCGATGSVVLIWDQRGDVTWTARDRTELWSELSMLIKSAVVPKLVQTPRSVVRQPRSGDNNSCNTSY